MHKQHLYINARNPAHDLRVKFSPCMCSRSSSLAKEMIAICTLYLAICGEDFANYLHNLAYSE